MTEILSADEAGFDFDLGPSEEPTAWLYKSKGVVCGPVSASALIDKIYSGEIDCESPVSPEFGDWRPLSEVQDFAQSLSKAVAALEAEREREQQRRLKRNVVLGRAGLLLLVVLSFSGTGFFGGRYLAIERPWEDHTDWSQRPPTLYELPAKPVPRPEAKPAVAVVRSHEVGATPRATEPARARLSKGSSRRDRAARDRAKGAHGKSKGKAKGPEKKAKSWTKSNKSTADKKETQVASAKKAPAAEYNAQGLPRALTQKQIMRVLATRKSAIVACLASEAKKNPDMPSTVTIEFVITSSGAPADFKVLERQVRAGTLASCLRTKIIALRWPRFFGENKTVKIPFNIKRR